MFPFYKSLKQHQKTKGIFRGYKIETLARKELMWLYAPYTHYFCNTGNHQFNNSLARIANFITFQRQHLLMKTFVVSVYLLPTGLDASK